MEADLPRFNSQNSNEGLTHSGRDQGRDALKIQAAALAAQQAAIADEEARLSERRQALREEEERLAAYLENKRQNILLLRDRVREDRNALEDKRHHLIQLGRRLRARWLRARRVLRAKVTEREHELCDEARGLDDWVRRLEERDAALLDKRLRFNALYELSRRQLRDAWNRLRQEQARSKLRRRRERAALKVRCLDLEAGERQLAMAQRLFLREKKAWDTGKARLTWELIEIDRRVQTQRSLLLERRQESLARTESQPAQGFAKTARIVSAKASATSSGGAAAQVSPEANAGLEQLAGDLADQRWQLLQTWHKLALLNQSWQAECSQAHAQVKEWAEQIHAQTRQLAVREEAVRDAESELRREAE